MDGTSRQATDDAPSAQVNTSTSRVPAPSHGPNASGGGRRHSTTACTAQPARARTDAGDDDPALADKVVIARFWAEQQLPLVRGRLGAVTAGFDDLMALGADRFASSLT